MAADPLRETSDPPTPTQGSRCPCKSEAPADCCRGPFTCLQCPCARLSKMLAEVELPAWREAGSGPASRWFIASRRRRVGVSQLGGELLELGRSRVALVATLERVEPAFA